MRIERHVFGSYAGYTTLARSAGLSADDARQLEGSSFAFGQTSDRAYLKNLRRANAYFTRVLRGGRRGLTRVLEGQPDDNGRPTLLMVTAVVPQHAWDVELCGDVAPLLDDASVWRWDDAGAGGELPALDRSYTLPSRGVARRSVPRVLALLSEVERRFASRQPVVVAASDVTFDEMRALEVLVPPGARGQFTSAYGSLSAKLPVSLNCIAAEADSQPVTFRADLSTPLSPYAAYLQGATSFADGTLPLGEIMEYRAFGRASAATASPASGASGTTPELTAAAAMPPVQVVHRGSTGRAVALSVLFGCVGLAAGYLLGAKAGPHSHAAPQPPSMATTTASSEVAPVPTPAPEANATSVPASALSESGPASAPVATPEVPTPEGEPKSQSVVKAPASQPHTASSSPGSVSKILKDLENTEARLNSARDARAEVQKQFRQSQLEAVILARDGYERLLATTNSVDEFLNAAAMLRGIRKAFESADQLDRKNTYIEWWAKHRENVVQLAEAATDLDKARSKLTEVEPKAHKRKWTQAEADSIPKEIDELVSRVPSKTEALPKVSLIARKQEYFDRIKRLRKALNSNVEAATTKQESPTSQPASQALVSSPSSAGGREGDSKP